MNATVIAVSRSAQHSFSKEPQRSITVVAGEGVEGDAHSGRTVQHLYRVRQDPTAPNLAQVHIFAAEMLDELAAAGFEVEPGQLGENVLTRGLELLSLPTGTVLRIGADAVLEVTGLRTPCAQIDRFRPGLQQRLWGGRTGGKRERRAGIMSIVVKGGSIAPGDSVQVELPELPHIPLAPV